MVVLKKSILLIGLIILIVPTISLASCDYPSISDGVISWWKFDNSVLDTQLLNNGTRYNFTNGYVTGKYNNALNFNLTAEQFIDIGNDSSLDFGTGDFSVEAWIKTNSYGGIIDKFNGAYGWDLYVDDGEPIIIFLIIDSESHTVLINSNTTIRDNNWHYVVAVREGYDFKLYIDGSLENTTNGIIDNLTVDENVFIGYDIWDTLYFNGTIDNVRIWNRSLNSTEILDLYQDDKLGICGVNYTNISLYASITYCLDNNTLFKHLLYDNDGTSGYFDFPEYCTNGCDNVTNSCNPLKYEQNVYNIIIVAAIIIFFALLIAWAKRRR